MRICSYLSDKLLMENFLFSAVLVMVKYDINILVHNIKKWPNILKNFALFTKQDF